MKSSEVIKTIRSALGLTQEEFAHAISTTLTTVNRWENDKATPNRMARTVIIEYCKNNGIDQAIVDAVGKIR